VHRSPEPGGKSSPALGPLHQLQKTAGNQVFIQMLEAGVLKPKLRISQPGDADEVEADRIADGVVSSPASATLQSKCSCAGGGTTCPECEGKEVGPATGIHRKATSVASGNESISDELIKSLGPGQALDSSSRAQMESRFGHDFSKVRMHADARASESAQAVDAVAYAAGQHIVFGAGQYAPHTAAGRHLLAHELAHVLHRDEGRLHRQSSGVKLGQPTISTDRQAARRKGEELRKVIESGKWEATTDLQLTHWLDFFEGEALSDFIVSVSPNNSIFGGEPTYPPDRDRVAVESGSLVIPKSGPREVRGGFSVSFFAQTLGEDSHSTSVEVYTEISGGVELGVELPIKKIAKFKFSVGAKTGRKNAEKWETKNTNRAGMTINRNYKIVRVERDVFKADFLRTMHGISKPDSNPISAGVSAMRGQIPTKSSSKLSGYSPQEIQAGYKIIPQEGGPPWGPFWNIYSDQLEEEGSALDQVMEILVTEKQELAKVLAFEGLD
jgi:hypothetical protein